MSDMVLVPRELVNTVKARYGVLSARTDDSALGIIMPLGRAVDELVAACDTAAESREGGS